MSAVFAQAVTVHIDDIEGQAGDSIIVPINISDTTGLGIFGADITLTYEPGILTAVSAVTEDTIASGWSILHNIATGQITIGMFSSAPLAGAGVLVNVNFSISETASGGQISPLALSNVSLNEGGVPATTIDGVFTVELSPSNGSLYRMELGWNLISVPVRLPSNAIDVVLQSIMSDCSSVWAYEAMDTGGEWKRYIKDAPGFLNTLETIEAGRGYWIQMDDPADLTLDGNEVAIEPIPLKPGWNLVGYNSLTARPIEEVSPSVCNSVWTYDAKDDEWKRYIVGGTANNLEIMEPGKGYWMNAAANYTWDVNSSIQTAPISPPMVREQVEPTRRVAPTCSLAHSPRHSPGIPYTIWGTVEANGMKMTGRDTACRVPTVILKTGNEPKATYRLGEVAQYGDYYVLDIPQAADGSAQTELHVQFEDTMAKAASVPPGRPGQTLRLDLHVPVIPEVSMLHQNYPNPFNPDTWIPYQLKEDADVVIRIYSVAGQVVRTLSLGHKPAGFYTGRERAAYWDGRNDAGEHVASGVYFYSIEAGDFIASRKIVMTR